MPDYEAMYHRMVNASEDALRALEAVESERTRAILIEAELLAEEQYIRETKTTVG